ncbi:hypothetical protein JRO89_XS01G0040300 [Xanthoceras sorbifolium]|uniref:Uncharacterized protein n=1 Tax=Xanthoceras sorbifolium TaxID=99658 RepID=A0ABQ8II79_9ROSI|nr:hypothetical protein JRO89_XS01G0040300 [Xanthoceras sorbifolium]
MSIPTSPSISPDSLYWHCEKNGFFSVKSAYWVGKLAESRCGSSGLSQSESWWKFLWRLRVPLKNCNLDGTFPDQGDHFPNWLLENNTKLEHLLLVNNSLMEPLQLPTHSYENLMTLDISMNIFNGHIPTEVGGYLPSLTILNISRNALEGNIPSSIGDMNSLIILDLSYNHLLGEIPEYLAKSCISLQLIVLSNNSLQGRIFSSTYFNLRNLYSLQLDGNYFSGKIPDSLSNTSLYRMYLSDNKLSGKILSWLGNMTTLVELAMPNNHLEGPIPPEFCYLNYLEVLNLAGNSLSSIPSCFSPLSLKQVHLSRNMLQGELKDAFRNSSVPIQLYQLDQLRLVDLSHNDLCGHIPPYLMIALRDKDYVI